MGEETSLKVPEEQAPLRLSRQRHPLVASGLLWLLGILFLAESLLYFHFEVRLFGQEAIAEGTPLLPILAGLGCGLIFALAYRRWLGKRVEQRAQASLYSEWPGLWYAFTREGFRQRISEIWPLSAIVIYVLLLLIWEKSRADLSIDIAGPKAGMGAIFLPHIFLYNYHSRIYWRAKQLLANAQGSAPESSSQAPWRPVVWPTILGVVSVAALLCWGVWTQWIAPQAANAEPKHFMTHTEPGGQAVQLTYGPDAGLPSLSPDGRFIAYVRSNHLRNQLMLMQLDGKQKRQLTPVGRPEVSDSLRSQWSADGKRLLFIGDANFPSYDRQENLWVIDVATAQIRKLTDTGDLRRAMWVPAARKIFFMRERDNDFPSLWLMDERGGKPQEVKGLSILIMRNSMYLWHDGREILAPGWLGEQPGIWAIDAGSGKVRRIVDAHADWAIPLDAERLLIVFSRRGEQSHEWLTDVLIFNLKSGDARWLMKDFRDGFFRAALAGQSLVFDRERRTEGEARQPDGLWGLNLENGKLRQLTKMTVRHPPAVAPGGQSLIYQPTGETDPSDSTGAMPSRIWRLTLAQPK